MQNSSTQVLFDNATEAKHYTDTEYRDFKFSIIDQIDNITRYDDKYYEFLMCYPEMPICNRWKQTVSPINYTEVSSQEDKVKIGYEPIDNHFLNFKGLMLSVSNCALLDGCDDDPDKWQFAIGVFINYRNDFYIPGGNISGEWRNFHYYELFLRIHDIAKTYELVLLRKMYFGLSVFMIYNIN